MKRIGVFIVALAVIMLMSRCFSTSTNSNLKDYEKRRTEGDAVSYMLPEMNTLGEYKDIHYQYRHMRTLTWKTDTMLLVVSYDKETYLVEKKKLERYKFLNHIVHDNEVYSIPEYEFMINSFDFRVVDNDKFWYPKIFGMVATSDEKNSIAYLYFQDIDFDLISEKTTNGEMENFIIENYKYEW